MSRPLKEISGLRYGKLVVIKRVGRTKHYLSTWKCICDCGKLTVVTSGNLHTGNTTNCGCTRWNKIREIFLKTSKEDRRGSKNPFFGKKHSRESLVKMAEISRSFTGKRAHNWRGGITPINQKIRGSEEYKIWRKHVFNRDNYTCQACGKRGVTLHADHELPFAYYPDLRFEILNGRTLCVNCHKKTDTYAGKARQYKKDFVFAFD